MLFGSSDISSAKLVKSVSPLIVVLVVYLSPKTNILRFFGPLSWQTCLRFGHEISCDSIYVSQHITYQFSSLFVNVKLGFLVPENRDFRVFVTIVYYYPGKLLHNFSIFFIFWIWTVGPGRDCRATLIPRRVITKLTVT